MKYAVEGIYRNGVVKLGKVFTIESSLIIKRISDVRDQTMDKIFD